MKKLLLIGLVLVFAGCGLFQTVKDRVNTVTVAYESVASVAFGPVKAYLLRMESNGSFTPEQLAKYKPLFNKGVNQFIGAGNTVCDYVDGKVPASALANLPAIFNQVAVYLADVIGGRVENRKMTVPKPEKYSASDFKKTLSPVEINMIISSLNLLLQVVVGQIGDSTILTIEEKIAFKTRIQTAQGLVTEWK